METEITTQIAANPLVVYAPFQFKPEITPTAEPINQRLKEHQLNSDDWALQAMMRELHHWAERFIFEFKLETTTPAIMVDRVSRRCLGHYRPGRNGFGLRDEIAINETYIHSQEFWETLGTLLHELLHAEQEKTGTPGKHNYHNRAFRDRAEFFGLIVDSAGHTQYRNPPSPFWRVLEKYGVQVLSLPVHKPKSIPSRESKLKLWVCDCQPQPVRIRVAIKDFQARCLKCGAIFRRKNSKS